MAKAPTTGVYSIAVSGGSMTINMDGLPAFMNRTGALVGTVVSGDCPTLTASNYTMLPVPVPPVHVVSDDAAA